jgi:hypothetical protein
VDWILENWQTLVAIAGAIVMAARLIVKLTPTPKDDAWLARIIDVLKAVGLHIDPAKPADRPGSGGTTGAYLLIPLAFLLSILGGCVAPTAVREGQAWEEAAWQGYIRNEGRIHDLTLSMYEVERTAARERATQDALARVKAKAVDGKLPADEFASALEVLCQEREKADGQTKTLVDKVRSLIAANNAEAAKALRIHGKMAEWLEAGIDESAVPLLVREAVTLIQSYRGPPATAPPAASASSP